MIDKEVICATDLKEYLKRGSFYDVNKEEYCEIADVFSQGAETLAVVKYNDGTEMTVGFNGLLRTLELADGSI